MVVLGLFSFIFPFTRPFKEIAQPLTESWLSMLALHFVGFQAWQKL
jgi:hypothetical protein